VDLGPRPDLWQVLVEGWVWTTHACVRVWDGARGEWRSRPTHRCATGCRFCPRGAR
jgi:hypothetical protein